MSDADRGRWNLRWSEREHETDAPSPWVTSQEAILPVTGRALDLAGGAGRHAIWLAQRGFDATLADISEVALRIARERASKTGLPLQTLEIDLETDPFPRGPWNVIVSFHYLQRSLFDVFPRVLAPGGVLLFNQMTKSNLLKHPRPPAEFLLEDGELPRLVKALEVVSYEEGWLDEGRHEARLVARKR